MRLLSAGGVVIRTGRQDMELVLCGHLKHDPPNWGLPKGTPEAGETREETAIREVSEETGLDVAIDGYIDRIEYWFVRPEDRVKCHKTVLFYLMSATGGDVAQHDHEFDDVRWFSAEQALGVMRYENEVRMVERGGTRDGHGERMTKEQVAVKGRKILLRDKRIEDTEEDYAWRVDDELARLDATRPLRISFREYERYTKEELEYPSPWSRRFAIDTLGGKHIGNCMYYDIDNRRGEAELGIVVGDRDYLGKGYGTDAVDTLLDHIYTTTDMKKVYLHTLEWNHRARRSFAKSGFREVRPVRRSGLDFIRMEVLHEEWEDLRRRHEQESSSEADR